MTIAKRLTTPQIRRHKKGADPLVALTCYTAPMARLLDAHVDILLVGDSLGMVVYGMDSTRGVTLDMMVNHAKAAVSHSKRACVVVDMPFGTYETSPEQALASAKRILAETGAQGVKLEGGMAMEETIRFLTGNGVAVMGHVGLLPQQVLSRDGYKYQGRAPDERKAILADAKAVERGGAFAMVIEATVEDLASEIIEAVSIPTIGIGASAACDGQVLVIDDLLGMCDYVPGFVKKYADLAPLIADAAKRYAADVRARKFPGEGQVFRKKK